MLLRNGCEGYFYTQVRVPMHPRDAWYVQEAGGWPGERSWMMARGLAGCLSQASFWPFMALKFNLQPCYVPHQGLDAQDTPGHYACAMPAGWLYFCRLCLLTGRNRGSSSLVTFCTTRPPFEISPRADAKTLVQSLFVQHKLLCSYSNPFWCKNTNILRKWKIKICSVRYCSVFLDILLWHIASFWAKFQFSPCFSLKALFGSYFSVKSLFKEF